MGYLNMSVKYHHLVLCKHGNKNLSSVQKELLKKAIDEANTIEELLVATMTAIEANNKGKS